MIKNFSFSDLMLNLVMLIIVVCALYVLLSPFFITANTTSAVEVNNDILDVQSEVKFKSEMYSCQMKFTYCGLAVVDHNDPKTLFQVVGRGEK